VSTVEAIAGWEAVRRCAEDKYKSEPSPSANVGGPMTDGALSVRSTALPVRPGGDERTVGRREVA
tara:strand:- start:4146 stop:4340 length:195 start_codon:yes stop_codon:yes gene_type:complete